MRDKKIFFSFCFVLIAFCGIAQDVSLDSLLDADVSKKNGNEIEYTEGTFKTSRIINSHSVETTQKGVLDLKISHRFGAANNGLYDLYGFDNAIAMRFGADYGLTNRLTIGGGRTSYEKEYDGFLKYRLLWQSTGKQKMPVSVTLLSSFMFATDTQYLKLRLPYPPSLQTADKFSYALQALIARKFSSNFSLQLMPTMVRNNLVPVNLYSLGIGGRLKLTKRSGIIAEYYQQLGGDKLPRKYPKTYNSFSLGYEIETGGHVFQFNLSNSTGITERTFITETYNPWSFSDLHFGFNISRVFTVKKPKSVSSDIQPIQNWSPPADSIAPEKSDSTVQYTEATFKTGRLINGHTVETTQKGVLDFKVTHRFGTLNSGLYNMFGLDKASMRIGADYGISDRLAIGVGRSTTGKIADGSMPLEQNTEKEYDAFLKYRLLWQSSGKRIMPVSVTLLSSVTINTLKSTSIKLNTSDRLYYAFQTLIAHKFSDGFSLQLAPTMVHYNLADSSMPNNLYSVGAGARIKLTKRTSLNLEYYYQLPGYKIPGTNNSFAVGYEIETGGHVFQLQLTNSYGMTERTFIHETRGNWGNGDIRFGFNISRVFALKKPKTPQQ